MTKKSENIIFGEGFADVKLSRPLDVDGNKLATLRMREPTVEDQLIAEEGKGSQSIKEITFMANLCGLAPDDIRKLPIRDFVRLQGAFAGFID